MKKSLYLFMALIMIVAAVGGCAKPAEQKSASETDLKNEGVTTTNDIPSEGENNFDADITIVQALDMVSWDSTNTSDLSNAYVMFNVYSRLFQSDENLGFLKELCKEYTMVSDTEWHFTIWENVKCHDGSILTADDVVFSLNRTKEGTGIGALFAPVKEITKVNELTVSITTDGPYPGLPTALTNQTTSIMPQSYVEAALAADDWSKPIGSGRYKFDNRVVGDTVKLTRFDDYFDADESAQNKSITFKAMPEGTNRTIAIETGEADLNVEFDTAGYDRVIANPELKLWEHNSQSVWHLGMDNTAQWFDNKLVRQAVNYAVDRESCLEVGHNGKGEIIYNNATFAPTCLGAVENPLDMYSYDPEKAKALMAEAGCTGFDTQIIVFRDEAERIATVVQANLAEIGINAEIVRIENAVFANQIKEHKAPMFITSWGCFWDPDLFLARRFSEAGIGGVNRGWYLNPEVDVLIAKGRSSFDNEVRAQAYKELQEFMAIEAPEADLYISTVYALSSNKLKGVELSVERAQSYHKLHY